jgi:hypothetical protein
MRRFLALVCVLALSACGGSTATTTSTNAPAATSAATSGTTTTPAPAATTAAPAAAGSATGIGAADVPAGFVKCPQSGDVSKSSDKDTVGEWNYQSAHGATSGDAEIFADSAGSCEGVVAVGNGNGKVIASVVVKFKDAATAMAGYGGMFGINSDSLSKMADAQTGSASGFGATSTYAYGAKSAGVIWLNGTTVIALAGQNVAEADFKRAATALKSRVG